MSPTRPPKVSERASARADEEFGGVEFAISIFAFMGAIVAFMVLVWPRVRDLDAQKSIQEGHTGIASRTVAAVVLAPNGQMEWVSEPPGALEDALRSQAAAATVASSGEVNCVGAFDVNLDFNCGVTGIFTASPWVDPAPGVPDDCAGLGLPGSVSAALERHAESDCNNGLASGNAFVVATVARYFQQEVLTTTPGTRQAYYGEYYSSGGSSSEPQSSSSSSSEQSSSEESSESSQVVLSSMGQSSSEESSSEQSESLFSSSEEQSSSEEISSSQSSSAQSSAVSSISFGGTSSEVAFEDLKSWESLGEMGGPGHASQ